MLRGVLVRLVFAKAAQKTEFLNIINGIWRLSFGCCPFCDSDSGGKLKTSTTAGRNHVTRRIRSPRRRQILEKKNYPVKLSPCKSSLSPENAPHHPRNLHGWSVCTRSVSSTTANSTAGSCARNSRLRPRTRSSGFRLVSSSSRMSQWRRHRTCSCI